MIDVLQRAGSYSQLKRKFPPDHPSVVEAHQQLVAARLLAHVSNLMASSPPLTADQVEQIAVILRGADDE